MYDNRLTHHFLKIHDQQHSHLQQKIFGRNFLRRFVEIFFATYQYFNQPISEMNFIM